jgi:hypothetical protein
MNIAPIVAAAQERERSLWEIGDALLEECGPPSEDGRDNGSREKLEEAAAEIEQLNIEGYSAGRLYNLRKVAHNFPPDRRVPGVSWDAHRLAGSPEMLEAIIKHAADLDGAGIVLRE